MSITWPINGSKWATSGFLEIKADVSDNVTVNKVEFYVDGTLVSTDNSEPYHVILRQIPYCEPVYNANHTIGVIVYDNSGNTASDNVAIMIVHEVSYDYYFENGSSVDVWEIGKAIVQGLSIYTYCPEIQIPNPAHPEIHLSGWFASPPGVPSRGSVRFNIELTPDLKSKLDQIMVQFGAKAPGAENFIYVPPSVQQNLEQNLPDLVPFVTSDGLYIKNAGLANVSGPIDEMFTLDGKIWRAGRAEVGILAPGEKFFVGTLGDVPAGVLKFIVDPYNKIRESNESNNEITVTIPLENMPPQKRRIPPRESPGMLPLLKN